jgi:hypothetical protein
MLFTGALGQVIFQAASRTLIDKFNCETINIVIMKRKI